MLDRYINVNHIKPKVIMHPNYSKDTMNVIRFISFYKPYYNMAVDAFTKYGITDNAIQELLNSIDSRQLPKGSYWDYYTVKEILRSVRWAMEYKDAKLQNNS